jgi:RNase P subunit RPR2
MTAQSLYQISMIPDIQQREAAIKNYYENRFKPKTVKVRVDHECSNCHAPIHKGESASVETGYSSLNNNLNLIVPRFYYCDKCASVLAEQRQAETERQEQESEFNQSRGI